MDIYFEARGRTPVIPQYRCQYQMIMSDIVHVLDSHSLAVHTEHNVRKPHYYKSTSYQMHETMEQCKSILRAAVKSQ